MELEQTYAGADVGASDDSREDAEQEFSEFFYELLSEMRY